MDPVAGHSPDSFSGCRGNGQRRCLGLFSDQVTQFAAKGGSSTVDQAVTAVCRGRWINLRPSTKPSPRSLRVPGRVGFEKSFYSWASILETTDLIYHMGADNGPGLPFGWTQKATKDTVRSVLSYNAVGDLGIWSNDVWMAGQLGRLRHWDGVAWRSAAVTLDKDLPVKFHPRDLGAGTGDVWAWGPTSRSTRFHRGLDRRNAKISPMEAGLRSLQFAFGAATVFASTSMFAACSDSQITKPTGARRGRGVCASSQLRRWHSLSSTPLSAEALITMLQDEPSTCARDTPCVKQLLAGRNRVLRSSQRLAAFAAGARTTTARWAAGEERRHRQHSTRPSGGRQYHECHADRQHQLGRDRPACAQGRRNMMFSAGIEPRAHPRILQASPAL